MIKITIVVPFFNAEASLRKCLESIVHQTIEGIEVLLIDDGSTDASAQIADEYRNIYPNIRVIHQANIGIFKTRAKAIMEANGEYIGWVDADDYVEPEMFEKLYILARNNDSDLAYCNYSSWPSEISTKDKWFRKYAGRRDVTFVERNSQFWNKIVKRDLLIDLSIPEMLPDCYEESMIKVLLMAKNPVWIDEPLYHYHVGEGSMSSRYKNVSYYESFINSSVNLKREMLKTFHDQYWEDYFSFRVIYYYLMSMVVAANAGNRSKYEELRGRLMNQYPDYMKNQHYNSCLRDIFGSMKAIAVGYVVPQSYGIANILAKIAFRGGVQRRRNN